MVMRVLLCFVICTTTAHPFVFLPLGCTYTGHLATIHPTHPISLHRRGCRPLLVCTSDYRSGITTTSCSHSHASQHLRGGLLCELQARNNENGPVERAFLRIAPPPAGPHFPEDISLTIAQAANFLKLEAQSPSHR